MGMAVSDDRCAHLKLIDSLCLLSTLPRQLRLLGSAASKFAGEAVYNRLINEPAYRESRWADALKDAFLKADVDLRAGT
jgi:hypothetical protein